MRLADGVGFFFLPASILSISFRCIRVVVRERWKKTEENKKKKILVIPFGQLVGGATSDWKQPIRPPVKDGRVCRHVQLYISLLSCLLSFSTLAFSTPFPIPGALMAGPCSRWRRHRGGRVAMRARCSMRCSQQPTIEKIKPFYYTLALVSNGAGTSTSEGTAKKKDLCVKAMSPATSTSSSLLFRPSGEVTSLTPFCDSFHISIFFWIQRSCGVNQNIGQGRFIIFLKNKYGAN